MQIWIDGDACPAEVKGILYSAAIRCNIQLVIVANSYLSIPENKLIIFKLVSAGADIADDYIAENVMNGDLVITADIPLAARIVEKGAIALEPRGELLTEENVESKLSMRDFMTELRMTGIDTGGPASYNNKDKQKFANSLDRFLAKNTKK